MLDALTLPWREPRRVVERRVGRRADPFYPGEVLAFDDAVSLPGSLSPWCASVSDYFSPALPITQFRGIVGTASDAQGNLRQAHDAIAGHLGAAAIGRRHNTLICEWRSGAADVALIAWPPDWQHTRATSDAHAAEPRLITACFVTVRTGFRLPPSEQEAAWLDDFQPADIAVDAMPAECIADTAPDDTELEYVRDAPDRLPRVHGRIGYPTDRAALIFCSRQLYVIPRELVLGFEVERLLPAKGGGGASLYVRCRAASPGVAGRTLLITRDAAPDGLNGAAQALAAAFGVTADIAPYACDA